MLRFFWWQKNSNWLSDLCANKQKVANWSAFQNLPCPLNRNHELVLQFYFSNIIVLTFFIYEPNSMENSFGKMVFLLKLMSRNFKWFIGRDFETVCPIFDSFFCCVCLFVRFLGHFSSDSNFNSKSIQKSTYGRPWPLKC